MWYFPFPNSQGATASRRGLLCINHEYCDQGILWPDGMAGFNLDKVRKALNAHGVTIVEIWKHPRSGKWEVRRPSHFARRLTGQTPMLITGPAAGHPLMRTAADPSGTMVLGTLNNCGSGRTPWDTYVTCEENWNGYFGTTDTAWSASPQQKRYGLSSGGFGYNWFPHASEATLTLASAETGHSCGLPPHERVVLAAAAHIHSFGFSGFGRSGAGGTGASRCGGVGRSATRETFVMAIDRGGRFD